jgi:signal transduction histidine kinase
MERGDMRRRYTILMRDDDPGTLELRSSSLASQGYQVATSRAGKESEEPTQETGHDPVMTEVSGEMENECETMDLREDVVDPVLDELRKELHESRIIIDNQLDVMPTNHIPVIGNRIWLRTVFRSLLRNAIGNGGRGCTVAIGIRDGSSELKVNVFNNGPPVPLQYRDTLFSRLSRSFGNGGSQAGAGVVTDLCLTREIIRKYGGDIWYEAKKHGSSFVFTIPRD